MRAQLGVKDLTDVELQRRLSDEQIQRQILRGSQDGKMPAFAGALNQAQVDAVVQYVRRLAGEKLAPPR